MDKCGGEQPRYHSKPSPSQCQVPHSGLSTRIHHCRKLKILQAYFEALPKPVLSDDGSEMILKGRYDPPSLTWNVWNKDPIKAAVLRAIFACQVRLEDVQHFNSDMTAVLTQNYVCSLHSYLSQVTRYILNLFRFFSVLRIFSFHCPKIQISGGRLLAMVIMFKTRRTCFRL